MAKLDVLRDAIVRSFAELDKVARAIEASAQGSEKSAGGRRSRRTLRVVGSS